MEENNLIQERLKKRQELLESNINPYPHIFKPSKKAQEIKLEHKNLQPEEHSTSIEKVAGRIMLLRRMGKATFLTIQDETERIQIYLRSDDIGKEKYDLLKKNRFRRYTWSNRKSICYKNWRNKYLRRIISIIV